MSLISVILLFAILIFPTFFLTICYPFSKKLALFWSNYITTHTCFLLFAILRTFRDFRLLCNKDLFPKLPKQFLVISNHQSLMDIVVYFCLFAGKKVRFVAKDNLYSVPMVGNMLRSQEHCMIPRHGKASQAMTALSNFGKRVTSDSDVIPLIFPEGTRSRNGNLGTFYSAGFRRLEETVKLPVVVCALDGGWKLSSLTQIISNFKKGAYRVKVLKIYDVPKNKEEEKFILEESQKLINAQLEQWRALPKYSLNV